MNVFKRNFEIFQYKSYTLFFIGTTVSMIGTGMQFIANSWLILQIAKNNSSLAYMLVCSSLPGILLSPVIGVYVDRFDKKWIAAGMDLIRALILVSIVFIWWLGMITPKHLYIMAFLIAMCDCVYTPSVMALVRELIPKDFLLSANATTSIANQVGALIGGGVAGIIIYCYSPIAVMLINAGSFLISSICILNTRKGCKVSTNSFSSKANLKGFMLEIREGIKYIRLHMDIVPKYMMILCLIGTLRTINVLLAPFAKDVLFVGSKGFGYIDASFAGGAIIGGIMLPVILRFFSSEFIMAFGMFALAGSLFIFSISQNLYLAMFGYLLIGLTCQSRTLYLTKVQESTDIGYQGRVHTTFNTLFSIVSVVIYLIMGYLSEKVSIRWLYGLQTLIIIFAGLIAFKTFYRKKEVENHVT